MATVPFSLRLDSEIKDQLEKTAKERDRSASYLAGKAIKNYLQTIARKKRVIDDAIEHADKGVFISQKAMGDWVDSWGTGNELSHPKSDIFINE